MVLNENSSGKPRRSLAVRTLLHVLAFGLGSLAFAGCVSFAMMSIADGVMPSSDVKTASTTGPKIIGAPKDKGAKSKSKVSPKPASKARRGRGNEGSADSDKSKSQPL